MSSRTHMSYTIAAVLVFALSGCGGRQTKVGGKTLMHVKEAAFSVAEVPNAVETVRQVDMANPGLIRSDCLAFQRKVMDALRAQDQNWGYCHKPGRTPEDIFMYGANGPVVDAVTSVCSTSAGVWWNVMAPNPDCQWGPSQTDTGGGSGGSGGTGGSSSSGGTATSGQSFSPLWSTGTQGAEPSTSIPSTESDRLVANQSLRPGQSVTSQNGRFRFIYQNDGNLVLYRVGGAPLWATMTLGTPGELVMQRDGNLVLLDSAGKPIWHSNTPGHVGAQLVVQNDGNVVIYGPGGSGGTAGSGSSGSSGTSGGSSGSGGTSGTGGATVDQIPNEEALVRQVNAENPGLMQGDCAGFQRKVMERLRAKDSKWGYCNTATLTWPDRFMYGPNGAMVDAVVSACSATPAVGWRPEPYNSQCVWGTIQEHPAGGGTSGGSTSGGSSSGGSTSGSGGNGTKPSGPPNEEAFLKSFSDARPGLINDCTGRPVANQFLIDSIRALQARDPRWGFMHKPGGRIPRDIAAYAWGNERDGTNFFFVVDYVMSGCSNTPSDPAFNDPNPEARVGWIVHNADTGFADNGVWRFDP